MSFLDRFPSNPSGDQLLEELRHFFQSSTKASVGDEEEFRESIRVGLWLIRHLPVARDSVLEIISVVYQEFVKKHLASIEVSSNLTKLFGHEEDFSNELSGCLFCASSRKRMV